MKLSETDFIFALDVERNDSDASGHPRAFNAIAVKVFDLRSLKVADEFALRLPDEWFDGSFARQILSSFGDIPTVASPQALYSRFWDFWTKWRDQGARVWVDTAKLESVFFEEVMCALGKAFNEGPWRVDDVRVLMLSVGYDADEIRSIQFAGIDGKINRHDPRADCEIVIACYRRCMEELGLR
jgi:hypothetical protein